jgi:hypothetical protein
VSDLILDFLGRAGSLLVVATVIAVGIASDALGGPLRAGFSDSLLQLGVSALVGATLAIIMALASRFAARSDRLAWLRWWRS